MATTFATYDDSAITILPSLAQPSEADEVNHRVANSLQLLSALVSIEARGVTDPAGLAALDMTLRRIDAVARVHRQLYQARATRTVDLGAYLDELGQSLEQGLGDAAVGRRVRVRAAAVAVSFEAATSIGIIVSELVTNACKYAYAPDMAGDVRIALRARPRGGYRLEIEDRGQGLLAGGTIERAGLGLRLVAMMAARLGGVLIREDAAPGTRFVLSVAPE